MLNRKHPIKPYYYLLAPAALLVLATTLFPTAYSAALAFTNMRWDKMDMNFVGFSNFKYILEWQPFWQVVGQSFVFAFSSVGLQLVVGFTIALALTRRVLGTAIVRTISILPWIVPSVIIAIFFKIIFNPSKLGLVNVVLDHLGRPPQTWLSDPAGAMSILITTTVWRNVGFTIILSLAALQTVPNELYESATIDGANTWVKIFRITIPIVAPTLVFILINLSAGAFNSVAVVYGLTQGGPARSTEVLALLVYRTAFDFFEAGLASSVAVVLLAINILMTLIYLRMMKVKEGPIDA